MLYDFYNYDIEKKEFLQLFIKFTQVRKEKKKKRHILFFVYFYNLIFYLENKFDFWLGFVEFGIVGGAFVLRWNEEQELYSEENFCNKEESQNKDCLRERDDDVCKVALRFF